MDKKRKRIKKVGGSQRETSKKRRQEAFLAAYKQAATITHAAEAANVKRDNHYRWLKKEPAYAEAFEEAKIAATDALIAEARRRAIQGVSEPVFYKGEAVGAIQKYSDTLLIFLIKGALPQVYRERYEISGGGKPVGIDINDPGREELTDDNLKTLIALAEQLTRAQDDRGDTQS